MRFLAGYIMRGRMAATTAAATLAIVSMLIPPLSILSSGAVALVTLRRGSYEAGFVLLASMAATGILGALVIGNFPLAAGYGLLLWLPVLLVASVLRVTGRLSWALGLATLLGGSAVCGYYLLGGEPASNWFELMKRTIEPLLDAAPPDVDRTEVLQRMELMSRYMTGLAAAFSVAGTIFGLLVGRWWQALLYNPGGFRAEFLGLRLGRYAAYVSLAFAVLAVAASGGIAEMALNVIIVLVVLYLMVGIAVLHTLFSASNARRLLLPLMYVGMFLIPHLLVPIALIGFGDTWFNWRRKVS